jgi:hypothetical protein
MTRVDKNSKLETIKQAVTVCANRCCPNGIASPIWAQLMNGQLGVVRSKVQLSSVGRFF